MTCDEAGALLDAFIDGELPGEQLLDVARHAGGCAVCDATVRKLSAMRHSLAGSLDAEAASLDLAGVWSAVSSGVAREDARRTSIRRWRAAPAWAAGLAMAAGAMLWLSTPPAREVQRVAAARPRPNQAVIDRLDSDSARLELRRERKYGTTLIMVSAEGDGQ